MYLTFSTSSARRFLLALWHYFECNRTFDFFLRKNSILRHNEITEQIRQEIQYHVVENNALETKNLESNRLPDIVTITIFLFAVCVRIYRNWSSKENKRYKPIRKICRRICRETKSIFLIYNFIIKNEIMIFHNEAKKNRKKYKKTVSFLL